VLKIKIEWELLLRKLESVLSYAAEENWQCGAVEKMEDLEELEWLIVERG
jgi:hypothetical protein